MEVPSFEPEQVGVDELGPTIYAFEPALTAVIPVAPGVPKVAVNELVAV